MKQCIYCYDSFVPVCNWTSLLYPHKQLLLCGLCEEKLHLIDGELCKGCGRMLDLLQRAYYREHHCIDCLTWKQEGSFLLRNHSLYVYNDFLKGVMAQFKYRGDYLLHTIFKDQWMNLYKKKIHSPSILVPIPLSQERLYERGFNQSEALASLLSQTMAYPLKRLHHEKQSKKTRGERLQNRQLFALLDDSLVRGQHIVLIDDVYTTGVTLRMAANCLKEGGALSVQSLTIAR
ncbi:ComF family protein [Priestia megaterium]|nr:ComF family protein [Priestia megaterium]